MCPYIIVYSYNDSHGLGHLCAAREKGGCEHGNLATPGDSGGIMREPNLRVSTWSSFGAVGTSYVTGSVDEEGGLR